jgi:hypothetical protein
MKQKQGSTNIAATFIAAHRSAVTSLGGGDWQRISRGWAAFPGPQPGEGQPESRRHPR